MKAYGEAALSSPIIKLMEKYDKWMNSSLVSYPSWPGLPRKKWTMGREMKEGMVEVVSRRTKAREN